MLEVKLHPEVVKFIKKLSGTKGRQDLYRLRIGNYRFIYAVEENTVWVTDAFARGRGYRRF